MADLGFEQIDSRRHAQDLRETWQAKVLAAAMGRMAIVIPSMLAHVFDDAMPVLMRVARPLCWDESRKSLKIPFLCSIGAIDKYGVIVAKVRLYEDSLLETERTMFSSLRDFETECRRLADRCRLSDVDRRRFFIVAGKWIGSDRRLDPSMDSRDPDAKRLVH